MNAPVTRRALLGATAAAGVVALPASVVAVTAPAHAHPDAELFAALDRWDAITADRPAMEATLDAAMDSAKAAYPPRPAALSYRSKDRCHDFCASASGREKLPSGVWRAFFEPGDVERLRAGYPVTRWACVDEEIQPPPRELDPVGELRRQEIIAVHDAWMAARASIDEATGYSASIEAWEAQIEALNAAEDAAKARAPRTLAGLARKAAWVADLLERDTADDELAAVFARQVVAFAGAAS